MRTLYFCPVVSSIFYLFFPRLISAVAEWMSTILPHMSNICLLSTEVNVSDVVMIKTAKAVQQLVVSSGSFGFSNWSQSERQRAVD